LPAVVGTEKGEDTPHLLRRGAAIIGTSVTGTSAAGADTTGTNAAGGVETTARECHLDGAEETPGGKEIATEGRPDYPAQPALGTGAKAIAYHRGHREQLASGDGATIATMTWTIDIRSEESAAGNGTLKQPSDQNT